MRGLAWLLLVLAALTGSTWVQAQDEPVLGGRAGFDLGGEQPETLELEAGDPLREQPDLRATELVSLPEALELPVLERRGSWAKVQYGHQRGWVLVRGSAPSPPIPGLKVRSLAPTAEELAELRRYLEGGGRQVALGPYRLLTDVPENGLLSALRQVVEHLASAYEQRFGLSLPAPDGEVVALFAEEARYRDYASQTPGVVELEAKGHAGNGLAALTIGGADRNETPALLIHELTHLMNRRALGSGDRLPPWLDEGLAEDLAYSDLTVPGKLRLGSLSGRLLLERLAQCWGGTDCPTLATLLSLSSSELSDPVHRQRLYASSAFFVRYLLDGEAGRRAPAFRAFLKAVSAGRASDASALAAALGSSLAELDKGFAAWLRLQAGVDRPAHP